MMENPSIRETWNDSRKEFTPLSENDPVFAETLILDLGMAMDQHDYSGKKDMVDKLVENYKLKKDKNGEVVDPTDKDIENLKRLGEALKDDKGDDLGVADELVNDGFDEDILLKVLKKSRRSKNVEWKTSEPESPEGVPGDEPTPPDEAEKTPEEVKNEVWYPGLDNDLVIGTQSPRIWIDRKEHSKGKRNQEDIDADVAKIAEAIDRMDAEGVDVRPLKEGSRESKRNNRLRIRRATLTLYRGKDLGMSDEEAKDVLETINIGVENGKKEVDERKHKEKREPTEASNPSWKQYWEENLLLSDPVERRKALSKFRDKYNEQLSGDERIKLIDDINAASAEVELRQQERKGQRVPTANQAMADFEVILNSPDFRKSMRFDDLRNWARKYKGVDLPEEFQKKVEREFQNASRVVIPKEVRENEDQGVGWFKWGRKQLAACLDINREEMISPDKAFVIEAETMGGRGFVDALPYIKDEKVKKQLVKEQEMIKRFRSLYFEWSRDHAKLKTLQAAFESGRYQLPTNGQVGEILNNLPGDNKEMLAGVGSKNVAKAIMLYFQMAVKGTENARIDRSNSLASIAASMEFNGVNGNKVVVNDGEGNSVTVTNIFNHILSPDEIMENRKKIQSLCGGEYYEALGLVLAKFMGAAARGYDNLQPAVRDADDMGKMIWSSKTNNWTGFNWDKKTNKWVGKLGVPNEKLFGAKSPYMWLPREIANYFFDVDEDTGDFKIENGRGVPIEASVDITTLVQSGKYYFESSNDPRFRYKITKAVTPQEVLESKEQVNSNLLFKTMLQEASLDEIDWSSSNYGILELLRFYESQSLRLNGMFKDLIDGKDVPISVPEFEKKSEIVVLSLGHLNSETKSYVGYLYMYSLLFRNSLDFLRAKRGVDAEKNVWSNKKMKEVVRMAKDAGLISKDGEKLLKKDFNLGIL